MRIPFPNRVVAGRAVSGMVLVLLSLLISSCVTDKEVLYLNDQIVALNKRVDGPQGVSKELLAVREQQAKADAELYQMRQEVQEISGRLEENNRLVVRAIERDTTTQDETGKTLADLKDRVSRLEAGMRRIHAYLNLEPPAPPQEALQTEAPPAAPGPQPAIQPPVVGQAVPSVEGPDTPSEQQLYDESMAPFREERYEAAIAGFKDFVAKYPKSDLADNAQFWIGESYMGLKQYEQAILAFQRVIKDYPKGNKVPNAILRQAVAFYEINDKTSAQLLLKKLIKQYPKSAEAKIAQEKLKTMK